jgi:hypothetical protein
MQPNNLTVMKLAKGHKETWAEKIDEFLFAYRTVPVLLGFLPIPVDVLERMSDANYVVG